MLYIFMTQCTFIYDFWCGGIILQIIKKAATARKKHNDVYLALWCADSTPKGDVDIINNNLIVEILTWFTIIYE